MSRTSEVPSRPPSERHSSLPSPWVGSRKYSAAPPSVSASGIVYGGSPGTSNVPPVVPSLRLSPYPPLKKKSPAPADASFTYVYGAEGSTIRVPAAVPSLVHRLRCCTPSDARKYSRSPTAVSACGCDPFGPGAMSRTTAVPAVVPSVDHSSLPAAAMSTAV
jgi:hypothetical protein